VLSILSPCRARVDSHSDFSALLCRFDSVGHVWDPQAKSLCLFCECAWFCHVRLVEPTSCETAV
jgi:hypothetical protein